MAAGAEPLKSRDAIKTYRYLRIGIIGAVVLLAVSIVIERSKVACWQTSISAYYYTPVRAVFVGSLFAIGLALLVYKARGAWGAWEDACLNFAGMLSPVVAIAPTTDVGDCWSAEPFPVPVKANDTLAKWVLDNIDNNFYALLIAGFIGLAVSLFLVVVVNGVRAPANKVATGIKAPVEQVERGTFLSLAITALALFAGWWLIRNWTNFNRRAHGLAAVLVFVFLIFAIIAKVVDHWDDRKTKGKKKWFRIYAATAALMIVGGILIPVVRIGGRHTVLVLEAYEMALFAFYWIFQTAENWDEEVLHPARGVGTLSWANKTGGRLRRRDRLALFVDQGIPTLIQEQVERFLRRRERVRGTGAISAPTTTPALQDRRPKTPLEHAAVDLCRRIYPLWLLHHCYRTYAIASALGKRRYLDVDDEVLFVASMLHDVGLTEDYRQGSDPQHVLGYTRKDEPCFAVRSAAVAQILAANQDRTESDRDALAEAISLHVNVRVPRYRGVEAHLLNAASAFDILRLRFQELPLDLVQAIEKEWPRGDSFCEDLWATWGRASLDPKCRAAFLNRRGFEKRVQRECAPA